MRYMFTYKAAARGAPAALWILSLQRLLMSPRSLTVRWYCPYVGTSTQKKERCA